MATTLPPAPPGMRGREKKMKISEMTEDELVYAAFFETDEGAFALLENKFPHRIAKESGLMSHLTRGNIEE